MRNYNEEIKVLADFKNRYVLIECQGFYGENPMKSEISSKFKPATTIFRGFVKDIDVVMVGEDANGNPIFERFLHIDSEYGNEVKLPYDKILAVDVLTNSEQARLEEYLRSKDKWELEIVRLTEMLNGASGEVNEDLERIIKSSIKGFKYALEQGEKLVEKGVKTFK